MVVPSDSARMKSFRIKHNTVHALITITAVFFLVLAGVLTYLILRPGDIQKEMTLLRENIELKNNLVDVHTKLALLENTVDRLERFDRQLRAMTNFADHRRKVAIGPLSEEEMLASSTNPNRRINEALALKLTENLGKLKSADLGSEVDRLLALSVEREKELAELTNFLEDQRMLLSHIPSIWPSDGWVTSGFGYRNSPFTNSKKFHEGLDIANNIGTPIHSPADGTVIYTGRRDGYGLTLVINHGFGLTTRYGHCSRFEVKVGDKVKRGDKVAEVGNTGRSTGPHLHYEVRFNNIPQNPRRYILE